MFGISKHTSYTDLLVSDILEVGDQIQAKIKQFKELTKRTQ